MKVKYNTVKQLSDKKLIEGMIHCYENSNSLFKSATILKRNKKFHLATSILTLSIEELVKGVSIFYTLIFEKTENNEEFLKELFDSRDLHSSRLDFALFLTHVMKAMNFKKIEKAVSEGPEHLTKIVKGSFNMEKISQQIEVDKKTLNNWFDHANERKNAGLYVSCNNNKWFVPTRIDEVEFKKAYEETKTIRNFLTILFKEFINADESFQEYAINYWKEVAKQAEVD